MNSSSQGDSLLWCVAAESRFVAGLNSIPDWFALISAADFHGLMPLLYSRLSDDQAAIPSDVERRLRQAYVDSAKRNLFLTTRLLQIVEEFHAASVPVVSLKGPALAASLYPDPALRPSFDLDLLIRPEHFRRALELLSRHGYALAPHFARLSESALLKFDCEIPLNTQAGSQVELHWAIAPDDYPFRFNAGVIWRSLRRTQLFGNEIDTLSPECLLLYLCVHGAKHAWSRLLWIGDVARRIDKGVNWNGALELASETLCRRPLLLGLLLVHDLLETTVPGSIIDQARADGIVASAARDVGQRVRQLPPTEPSSVARTLFNARLAERRWDKAKHWAAMFKAPKEEDLARWQLPSGLFFLYYPLRVERLARKYLRLLMRKRM